MKISLVKSKLQRIFILEDDQGRIDWFCKLFKDVPNVFITKQSGIAIEELGKTVYDLIFLDHDLDCDYEFDEDRPDHVMNTGYEVAKRLKDTGNIQTQVIVHSMNPVGAANMIACHPHNIVHVPFFILQKSLILED